MAQLGDTTAYPIIVPQATDLFPFTHSGSVFNATYSSIIMGVSSGRTATVTIGMTGQQADYICDGVADNVEFQSAVDYLNSIGGGRLAMRAGNYFLEINISIKQRNNICFQGEGVGVTILNNFGISKNDTTATSNMTFYDFTVDCHSNITNGLNLTTNSLFFHVRRVELKNTRGRFLLQWGGNDRLIVEDCYFYDGGLVTGQDNCAGGQLTTTNNTSIFRNNWFVKEFSAGGGLLTTGQTGNVLFEGNSFIDLSNNCYAAISCEQQTGNSMCVQVINNKSYRVGFQLGVSSNLNTIDRGVIKNNIQIGVAGTNTSGGITTNRVKELLIEGNVSSDTSYGIFCNANIYAKISHNYVKNTNSSNFSFNSDKAGIFVSDQSGGLEAEISNNTVWDDQSTPTTPYGIRVLGSANRVYLENNRCPGPYTVGALSVTSTQAMLSMSDNDFSGGTVSLGTITTFYAKNNIGYNPVGLVTVAVPSSGTATSVAGYDRTFYITAGVSTVACAVTNVVGTSQTVATIPASGFGAVFVPANSTLTPTYANLPTWTVQGN